MKDPNIPQKYIAIWRKAVPYLEKCRNGDLMHSQKAAEEVYRLGENEKWDMDVLIPVAIFHDIGHSVILPEHFRLISGPNKEDNAKLVHMLTGSKIDNDVLKSIDYPQDKIEKIVEIISIHDKKDKSLFDTIEKQIFHDVDRLDRFSEDGVIVAREEFGMTPPQFIKLLEDQLLAEIISDDFREIAQNNLAKLKANYQ
jgi:HD superfamily phosphodiesterase